MAKSLILNRCAAAHLIILCHGLDGTDHDLDYVKRTLMNRSNDWGELAIVVRLIALPSHPKAPGTRLTLPPQVHSSSANHGKTKDGVAEGGFRLAMEVAQVIRKQPDNYVTKISFVGHSLGACRHYKYYLLIEALIRKLLQYSSPCASSYCFPRTQICRHLNPNVDVSTPYHFAIQQVDCSHGMPSPCCTEKEALSRV